MMALQMLLLLEVIIILFSPSSTYPVYGTKRYGRSVQRMPYQMVRPHYYELYPSYSQESYPLYYPRTSKYEVYQAVLPYYYARPSYGYYENDLQDELMQEAEREEREDSQPIGHELLYENEEQNNDDIEEVNAAFLQNLIMSQMYKEALDNQRDYDDDDYEYARWEDTPKHEDKDVKELKQLVKPKMDDIHWFKHSNFRNQNKRDKQTERKSLNKLTTTTSTTIAPTKRESRGQKEEVLMRPATPVRHPFSNPVLDMMSKDEDRKREPSVYDTIKHMLDMEKSLENKYGVDDIKPQMKKRIIASEESLTKQLSVLKKMH